jgi:hypothetical protein
MGFNNVARCIQIPEIGHHALLAVKRSTSYHLIHDAMKMGTLWEKSTTVSACHQNGSSN